MVATRVQKAQSGADKNKEPLFLLIRAKRPEALTKHRGTRTACERRQVAYEMNEIKRNSDRKANKFKMFNYENLSYLVFNFIFLFQKKISYPSLM